MLYTVHYYEFAGTTFFKITKAYLDKFLNLPLSVQLSVMKDTWSHTRSAGMSSGKIEARAGVYKGAQSKILFLSGKKS